MRIAILGSGFIARFYAESLMAQRRKDTLILVYSRSAIEDEILPDGGKVRILRNK